MIKSDDLLLVSLLSKGHSIASVAKELHLTPSAISQRLSMLETKLGFKIAERNGRSGIVLTSDGEFLANRAPEILSELELIQDEVNERQGSIGGTIRITAPFGFGRHHIAPALGQLSLLYPQLTIDLNLSDDLSHTPQSAWDIIIRVAPSTDSSLKSTTLAKNRRQICASPKYVEQYGCPADPEDIKQHQCIAISEDGTKGSYWHLISKSGEQTTVRIEPKFVTNDGDVALDWAIDGLGLIVRSEWSAAPAIKAGRLIELMPGWELPEAPIVALTSNRHAESTRIQTVLSFLSANIGIDRNCR